MHYLSFTFHITEEWQQDLLIADLDAIGFQGYEQKVDELVAFIPADKFDESIFQSTIAPLTASYGVGYESAVIAERNWNEEWERGFQPILIEKEIAVRASFHAAFPEVKHDIIIDPRMSFGTGHHATTEMMMRLMLREAFEGRVVLDFGSGTGILSVLASKLHAASVLAVDHEKWAYHNAIDNFRANNVHNATPVLGDADAFSQKQFQIILANINRSIILATMPQFAASLDVQGKLLISGFLKADESALLQAADNEGFAITDQLTQDDWMAMTLLRN
ncbi:MAG: 50S ribosomal protein L11 methyltransferase [Chitinophagales bacterium]|nr:50S ribosomal protein L11 methyltransferase [Chitinophagales bacterium]